MIFSEYIGIKGFIFMGKITVLLTIILYCSKSFAVFSFNSGIRGAGDILQIGIPCLALAVAKGDSKGEEQLSKSVIITGIITHSLKRTIRKKRPNSKSNERNSSVSGHTSLAFSGASFLHRRYGIRESLIPYIGAVFVGYSRIKTKQHRISEVVAGAAIAEVTSFFMVTPKVIKSNYHNYILKTDILKKGARITLIKKF